MGMKIWVDDVRPAPGDCFHEWLWCRSVDTAKCAIEAAEQNGKEIDLIDLDHDAGDYADRGGDYIKLLDWMVETERFYPVKLHTMNPVGRESMQRTIDRYWGGKK